MTVVTDTVVKETKEVNGKCHFGGPVALKNLQKLAHLLTLATAIMAMHA